MVTLEGEVGGKRRAFIRPDVSSPLPRQHVYAAARQRVRDATTVVLPS
jgi:hypothetical protein